MKHSTVATFADEAGKEVNKAEWNDDHVETVGTIAANSAGTQGAATQLAFGINILSDTAAEGYSVKLPTATGSGKSVICASNSTWYIVIFPESGGQIDNFSVDNGYAIFPIQRIEFRDSAAGQWELMSNLPLLFPIYNSITAFAGGGQGSAVQLGYGTNVITTCATAADSVKMPQALGGCEPCYVINLGAASCNIYPRSGQQINALAANTPMALPAGSMAVFTDMGPTPSDRWAGGMVINPGAVAITGGSITGITDLAVADGGTGASAARAAAANLAVAYILGKSAVAVSGAADTNENTLATITVPANAMGANGQIHIRLRGTFTNNANVKTLRIRLGGIAGTILFTQTVTSSVCTQMDVVIGNVNDAAVQVAWFVGTRGTGTAEGGAAAPTAGAVDTTAAQDLVITMQKATGTDTMTLTGYSVLLLADGT